MDHAIDDLDRASFWIDHSIPIELRSISVCLPLLTDHESCNRKAFFSLSPLAIRSSANTRENDPTSALLCGETKEVHRIPPPPAPSSSAVMDTAPSSSATDAVRVNNRACAACKYQRKKCNPDCVLAPYFPADNPQRFVNFHNLFGVSSILQLQILNAKTTVRLAELTKIRDSLRPPAAAGTQLVSDVQSALPGPAFDVENMLPCPVFDDGKASQRFTRRWRK